MISSVIYINDKQKQMSHGGHLEFQDGHHRCKFENDPIEFVGPKDICLDTNIMFLGQLETEISKYVYYVTPRYLK